MDPLLDISEVSRILGVPKSWLYEKTRRREIPHLKLGKYLKFDPRDIEKFVGKMRRGRS